MLSSYTLYTRRSKNVRNSSMCPIEGGKFVHFVQLQGRVDTLTERSGSQNGYEFSRESPGGT